MAAVDFFLKIDGIDGESADSKHKNEIDLQSWSWGASQLGTHGSGGGGGAGKANVHDFNFSMHVNKASPKLFLALATGQHIKKAVLTCRKAGKDQQEYMKISFEDVLISSYQTSGSEGSIVPTEGISLNFAKVEIEYKEQKSDGTLGGTVKAGYDVKANKAI